MKQLANARVFRGGKTSNYLQDEHTTVSIGTNGEAFRMRFEMKSKGGGVTLVFVDVGSPDFGQVLSAMADADRSATMGAASKEVAHLIEQQPEIEAEIRSSALDELEQHAFSRIWNSPAEAKDLNVLIHNQIKKLKDEIEGVTQ